MATFFRVTVPTHWLKITQIKPQFWVASPALDVVQSSLLNRKPAATPSAGVVVGEMSIEPLLASGCPFSGDGTDRI